MIICPVCRTAHVKGTLFCEQCGTSLIGVEPVDTTATEPWTPAMDSGGADTIAGAAASPNGVAVADGVVLVPVSDSDLAESESAGTLPLPNAPGA